MQRCYCGHSGGSFTGSILKTKSHHVSRVPQQQQQQQQMPHRSDIYSLTSSSRQSVRPTKFVKQPNPHLNAELGLGHSKSGLSRDFSRRNSATTTLSHCSSCCSSCSPQKQRESRVKVLSWGTGERSGGGSNNNNCSHCEHTDNRRLYEQRACVASRLAAQGQVQGRGTATPSPTMPTSPTQNGNEEMQRLLSLQQFRLLNASDCFSAQRQDELRLQRAYDKLGVAENAKWQKNKANECRQQTKPAAMTTSGTTPYALRQRLLQLQLREEQASGTGSGALCAPMGRSCALRFN
ncbi:uncharacterized protein LOC6563329 [Drosophila grimshawi]|uniref:GH18783 n=1 Tax=Drosophila grimshawi TaxID=7222 RepID=B4JG01_DROGR|nr:uncharacterized protein LOC6563329 [Drosophila grimshawi]EDV92540.1 GH18783 [Drosophila grimshawi]